MIGLLIGVFIHIQTLLYPFITAPIVPDLLVNRNIYAFIDETTGLQPQVLKLGMTAYNCALKSGIKDNRHLLTIIDYSRPSNTPRLWVINTKTEEVLYQTLVAHGKDSGNLIPEDFSDQTGSDESSLGLYLTKDTYFGHDGYSLVLQGLDVGFNDKAETRRVVMHGAWYVSKQAIARYGRIGRSWGCPALDEKVVKPVIDKIKNGTLLFAYYPNPNWLGRSIYLHCGL